MPADLRQAVAEVLESLSIDGGPHHMDAPAASWRVDDGVSLARLTFQRELVDRILDGFAGNASDSRSIIITAGSPGAGKSSAVRRLLTTSGSPWLRVDPDEIKVSLLREGVRTGQLASLMTRELPDGGHVMPLELSALVHRESVQIALDLTQAAMAEHVPIIVEGTLSWPGQIAQHLDDITRHGYRWVQLLAIEVDEPLAQERALDRWWQGRRSGAELGGRFLPAAVIRGCYDEPGQASRCLTNARELARQAADLVGVSSSITVVE